jgi:hypothetical protein
MSPSLLRAYVTIVVRDVVIPIAGICLTFYLAHTHQLAYWHFPLLAGMLSVPLVARSDPPKPPEPPKDESS